MVIVVGHKQEMKGHHISVIQIAPTDGVDETPVLRYSAAPEQGRAARPLGRPVCALPSNNSSLHSVALSGCLILMGFEPSSFGLDDWFCNSTRKRVTRLSLTFRNFSCPRAGAACWYV